MSEEKQKTEPMVKVYDSRTRRSYRETSSCVEHADDGSRLIIRPDGKIVSLYLP
jgi:hypothetical protein